VAGTAWWLSRLVGRLCWRLGDRRRGERSGARLPAPRYSSSRYLSQTVNTVTKQVLTAASRFHFAVVQCIECLSGSTRARHSVSSVWDRGGMMMMLSDSPRQRGGWREMLVRRRHATLERGCRDRDKPIRGGSGNRVALPVWIALVLVRRLRESLIGGDGAALSFAPFIQPRSPTGVAAVCRRERIPLSQPPTVIASPPFGLHCCAVVATSFHSAQAFPPCSKTVYYFTLLRC
jgi:hypothetical protein